MSNIAQYPARRRIVPSLVRHAIPFLAVGAVFAFRRTLDPVLGMSIPFMYFMLAVIVTGWLAGTVHALVASVLSAVVIDYYYFEPIGHISLATHGDSDVIQLWLFLIVAFIISMIVSRLRQMMKTARRNEERFRAIFDNAALGIVEVDDRDRFILANDRFLQTVGYSREEVLQKTAHDMTYPDDRAMSDQVNALIHSGSLNEFEYEKRYVKRDGSPIWVHITVSAIRDEAGRVIRHIGTIEDITKRKAAEEALRGSEEVARNSLAELRAIYDTAPIGLCLLDTDLRYISVNNALARINHHSVAEHIGRKVAEVLSPELLNRAMPHLHKVLETGEATLNREVSGEPTDDPGRKHYWLVSYYPVRVADRIIGIGGVVQEITDLKKAEQALRESERLFRELADSMPQIVWAAKPDGMIDYFNHQYYELTHAPYELIGDIGWLPILHPDDRDRSHEAWYESVRTGLPFQIEQRFIFPGLNEYRWHLTRALPVRDEAGLISRWFGTCTDIHDQKMIQAKLADHACALAEADRRKDEFLAMLAHELRNPLAPILYAVQMLNMKSTDQPALQKLHDMIDRQVRHMGRLIDDLLDVSRITRGKIVLKREKIDLRTVAEQVIDSIRPQVKEHELILNSHISPTPLPVEGDPTRLEQIMRNLLNNAIKFTPRGGSIWVTVESEPAGDGVPQAVIHVRDTGIGMAPEVLGHVFDLFAQAQQSLARTQGGLGIGLTMVKSLTELHGGRVEAFSEGLDHGSEFVVFLPLAETGKVEPVETQPAVAPRTAIQRVLIVDDNEDLVVSLSELIKAWGCEVRTALDGPEAVRVAREWKPEVVVLDIGLPTMDGYAVARSLRGDGSLKNTCIVALTGYGSENDRRRAMEAGFNYHLTKPVETEKLRAILGRANAA